MPQDGMIKVRAELCDRIDGLRASVVSGGVSRLCERASEVRRLAQQYDLRPVADLAWKLEGRLARGDRGVGVSEVLALMREATESGRADQQASDAWQAAASIRAI
jgi:hypothetical protein